MSGTYLLGVFLGILGALLMNVGKGVQKQHVHVFIEGRAMFAQPHRRTLLLWTLGFAMTASAAVPYNLALKFANSPSTISAMTGVGLLGLAVYATRVIGEKLATSDVIGIGLILLGTSAMSYLGAGEEGVLPEFAPAALARANAIIFSVCVAAALLALAVRRIHGLAFGLAAGLFVGLAMFMADVGLVRAEGSFLGQFAFPFVYIAIAVALTGLVCTQIGFLRARALEVVPTLNAVIILTPLLLERVIYGQPVPASRLILVLVIVMGVVLLSVGAGSGEYEDRDA
jgi:hypothetical protein